MTKLSISAPKSEALYAYLFQHSPLPIWIADRNTLEFVEVNKAAVRTYGYSREEFLQMSVTDLRAWDRPGQVHEDYLYLAENSDHRLERKHRKKNGDAIHVLLTAHALVLDGREMNLVQVVDITDRKLAEDELSNREKTFSDFLDSALDAVITIDDQGRVLEWRGQAEEIFLFKTEEMVGELLAEKVIPERYRSLHYEGLERFRNTKKGQMLNQRLELTGIRKDGIEFPLSLEITAIPRGSNTIFGAFIRDLTEEKARQSEIDALTHSLERRVQLRTHELEQANRNLEGFTYSVSHDLRGPLRAIIANGAMVVADFGELIPSRGKEMLERQSAAARKMGALIDAMLGLSRISRQGLNWVDFDFSALVNDAIEDLRNRLHPENLKFDVASGMTAFADPRLIRMVVMNLTENAIKFSPNGGMIEVGIEKKAFFVRDQGVGFDMRFATKIFEPFERLVNDSEFPGTGIGLANVRKSWSVTTAAFGAKARSAKELPFISPWVSLPRRASSADSAR